MTALHSILLDYSEI